MKKIALIISREYLTRVKKKSFIIMTLISPLIFAALLLGPTLIMQMESTEQKVIAVIDDSHILFKIIPDTESLKFEYLQDVNVDDLKDSYKSKGYYGVLYISQLVTYEPNSVILYSHNQPSFDVKSHISNAIENEVQKIKLTKNGIDSELLNSIKTDINVRTVKWDKEGGEKESSTEITTGIAYVSGFMIYMFVFMFGVQVMRGVIEEKVNRIIEVIVSSVKPFQLMMGKIIGIACVGLTQFLAWIILTLAIVAVGQQFLMPDAKDVNPQQQLTENLMSTGGVTDTEVVVESNTDADMMNKILDGLNNLPIGLIVGMFIFYFLGGYLLYAALFAIVGSAVDNETDTQQFMAPITIPLILGLFVMISTIMNPDGPISVWFSIIPFTSPIVMMARIPFGVPVWQLALSVSLLIATFLLMTWLAAKIYRVGILMYGKKASYKELWKWLKYKN